MLRDPECCPDVFELVDSADFYWHHHQLIASAIKNLRDQRKPVDLVTVWEALAPWRADIPPATLTDLFESVPTAANAEHHAKIVRDRSVRRGLIRTAQQLIQQAMQPGGDAAELAVHAGRAVAQASDRYASPSVCSLDDVLGRVVDQIDLNSKNPRPTIRRPYGFLDLDKLTAGLHDGELVTVGARPGVGKSAFALAVAEAVIRAGELVLFVSLEMSGDEQGVRMMVAASGVASAKLRRGKLLPDDIHKLATAHAGLSRLPMMIDDDPHQTVLRIGATARRLHRKKPLGLLVVDYLQLIRPTDPRVPRHQQVADQTRELKLLAKDLKCPILLLAQLNRQVEEEKRRPRLSDLRESGAVEQDSDTVIFLHPDGEPTEGGVQLVDAIVAKQRNGPRGDVALVYSGQTFKFSNYMVST